MEKEEVLNLEKTTKKKKKLKLWVKIFIIVLLLFIILLMPIIIYNHNLKPVSKEPNKTYFTIDSGMSAYNIGEKLYDEGFIKSSNAFKIYVKLNNITDFKSGTFLLDKSDGTKNIINTLLSGKTESIKITFKEGKTIRGVASEIAKNTNIKEEDFYNKINNSKYIDSLINKYWFLTNDIKNKDIYYALEGYLYPETYIFSLDVNVETIINKMLDQTNKVFTKYKDLFNKSKYSVNEIVTMASIIESEGIYKDDRKNIAGVFYNRLNKNMPLGSDVTTYYAFKVDLGTRDITKKELNTYNPYNTRGPKMEGKLPIGAISNFSETSLEAALNPNNNDYLFFVADKSGKTHFTKTYQEHQKIIKELKQANNWIEW